MSLISFPMPQRCRRSRARRRPSNGWDGPRRSRTPFDSSRRTTRVGSQVRRSSPTAACRSEVPCSRHPATGRPGRALILRMLREIPPRSVLLCRSPRNASPSRNYQPCSILSPPKPSHPRLPGRISVPVSRRLRPDGRAPGATSRSTRPPPSPLPPYLSSPPPPRARGGCAGGGGRGAGAGRPRPGGEEPIDSPGAIAIVGMGIVTPGASTPDEFWNVLRDGPELMSSDNPERIRPEYFSSDDWAEEDKTYQIASGYADAYTPHPRLQEEIGDDRRATDFATQWLRHAVLSGIEGHDLGERVGCAIGYTADGNQHLEESIVVESFQSDLMDILRASAGSLSGSQRAEVRSAL